MALPKWMTEMNNAELVADATNAAIAKALQKANAERSEMADVIAGLRAELRKTKSLLVESESRANALDETAGHFQVKLQEAITAADIAHSVAQGIADESTKSLRDMRKRLSIQENVSDEWRKSANYWRAETVECNLRAQHYKAEYESATKFIDEVIDDQSPMTLEAFMMFLFDGRINDCNS